MTYEEALRWTDDSLSQGKVLPEQESYAYMGVVKIALAKQTPKKPLCGKCGVLCPSCHRKEYIVRRDALDTHCGFCGQAIDWSEDK